VQVSAATQAPDGTRLAAIMSWTVAKISELPNASKNFCTHQGEELTRSSLPRHKSSKKICGPVLFAGCRG